MSKNGKEILCEGWLTKSPPTKRIFRGRWRKRWFSLHPGELPEQFFLAYYTDRNCRKLKGYIDLDNCEQVDTGLKYEDKKFKFDFLFAIKTPPRTYYLAAETDIELRNWVKCICEVCGLKATSDGEETIISVTDESKGTLFDLNRTVGFGMNKNLVESPSVSPVSTSPYIPISECITGKTRMLPNTTTEEFNTLNQYKLDNSLEYAQYMYNQNHENLIYESTVPTYLNFSLINAENDEMYYDRPRLLLPHKNLQHSKNDSNCNKINSSPLQSPTDSESVFTDDDSLCHEPGAKLPKPSNSSAEMDLFTSQRVAKLSMNSTNAEAQAPPRPPKPARASSNYYFNVSMHSVLAKTDKENISITHVKSNSMTDESTNNVITDDMYDFPRSHQVETEISRTRRHCYNNAAPVPYAEGQIFKYDISPKPGTSNSHVFRYDVEDLFDVPASPSSQTSSIAVYSNLPSPLLSDSQLTHPPKVNRCLKPTRKVSDTLSLSSNPESSSPRLAPSVDRKLKPPVTILNYESHNTNILRKTFDDDEENFSKIRAAPSPTSPAFRRSHDSLLADSEQIYHTFPFESHYKQNYHKLEYLDLDLDNQFTDSKTLHSVKLPSATTYTVYKKVDFMKTEAFNITKNNLEKERKCKK